MNLKVAIQAILASKNDLCFLIALLFSMIIMAVSVIRLRRKLYTRFGNDTGRSFQLFLLGVLCVTAVLFLPVYVRTYPYKDNYVHLRPFFLSPYYTYP